MEKVLLEVTADEGFLDLKRNKVFAKGEILARESKRAKEMLKAKGIKETSKVEIKKGTTEKKTK